MAIRQAMGFNHLPKGTWYGGASTGYGLGLNGYGIVGQANAANGTGSSGQVGTIGLTTDGILMIARMPGNHVANVANSYFGITLTAKHTDGVSRKSILAFRCIPNNSRNDRQILQLCGITLTNAECGLTDTGNVNYCEVVIDRTTNTVSTYNTAGQLVTTKAATTSLYSAGNVVTFGIAMSGTAYTGTLLQNEISRITMIDDTQDDTPCDRMGPVDLIPITVGSVNGSDYVTSDGSSLTDCLNSAFVSTASMIAPYAQSPSSLQPLGIGLSASGDPYGVIKGLAVMVSAKKDSGTDCQFKVSLSQDGNTVQGDTIGFNDSSFTYYNNFAVQNKAPDGGLFTWAKINALTLNITPVPATP
jgi:hypothetical protein